MPFYWMLQACWPPDTDMLSWTILAWALLDLAQQIIQGIGFDLESSTLAEVTAAASPMDLLNENTCERFEPLSTLESALLNQDTGPVVFLCFHCKNFLVGRKRHHHHMQSCHSANTCSFLQNHHVDMLTNQFTSSCYKWINCLDCRRQQSRRDDHISGLKNWKSLVDWPRFVSKIKALSIQKTAIAAVSKAGILGSELTKRIALLSMRSRCDETSPFRS